MKKVILSACVALLVLSFIPSAFSRGGELQEGDLVDNFILKEGLTMKNVSFIDNIKGKTKYTAIIFANTACGACRKEMRTLSDLSSQYEDFMTYVVLVDMRGADIVSDYDKQFQYDVTYLLDPDFSIPPVYGFSFTPSMLIVDKAGVIVYKKGGYNIKKDKDLLIRKVRDLFK